MRGRTCSLTWMRKWRDFLLDPNTTLKEKAEILCFTKNEVSNLITILRTKETLQEKVEKGDLNHLSVSPIEPEELDFDNIQPTHYRFIATIPNEEKQLDVAQKIAEAGLTVKETRKLVKEIKLEEEEPTWNKDVKKFFVENTWLRSLVDYPNRGPFGDGEFRGNASGWLLAQLIYLYKPETVYDPMEGSKTSRDVCEAMGVKYVGNDILNPDGYDLVEVPLNKLPETSLTYFHPPYHNIIKYSDHPNDLSNQPTYEKFLELLFACIDKLLVKTERLILLVGDIFDKETFEFQSIGGDIFTKYRNHLIWRLIKTQHSVSSGFSDQALKRRNPYYIPLRHEDVLILRGGFLE